MCLALPADRRLCHIIMPQPPRRGNKRKRPPEELPSSVSLEVVSLHRQGGRIVKKRVVEKMERPPPITLPNAVLPALGLQAGPSIPADNILDEPFPTDNTRKASPEATSRSVSVSFFPVPRHHHLFTFLADQSARVDSVSHDVPPRSPFFGVTPASRPTLP